MYYSRIHRKWTWLCIAGAVVVSICALYYISIKSVEIATLEQNNNPRATPTRDLSQEMLSTIEILLQQGRQFLKRFA